MADNNNIIRKLPDDTMIIESHSLVHSVNIGDSLLVDEELVIVTDISYGPQASVIARVPTDLEKTMTREMKIVPKKIKEANLKRSKAEWGF